MISSPIRLLAALAGAGIAACGGPAGKAAEAPVDTGEAVRHDAGSSSLVMADTVTVELPLALPAQLYVEHDAAIYARSPGIVEKVLVDLGSQVGAGQLLARLESADQSIALAQADRPAPERGIASRATAGAANGRPHQPGRFGAGGTGPSRSRARAAEGAARVRPHANRRAVRRRGHRPERAHRPAGGLRGLAVPRHGPCPGAGGRPHSGGRGVRDQARRRRARWRDLGVSRPRPG